MPTINKAICWAPWYDPQGVLLFTMLLWASAPLGAGALPSRGSWLGVVAIIVALCGDGWGGAMVVDVVVAMMVCVCCVRVSQIPWLGQIGGPTS